MTVEYKWSSGGLGVPAQVAGEFVESMRQEKGHVTAREILDAARSEESPIHAAFCWDDTEAAEKWRLRQAGEMLRCLVRIVKVGPDRSAPVRAFVSIENGNSRRGYVSVDVAMADDDMRGQLLRRALDEAKFWKDQYARLQELAPVFAAISEVEQAAAKRRGDQPKGKTPKRARNPIAQTTTA